MKLGDPQGLLLTETSAGSMFIGETAKKGMVFKRWILTIAVTKNLIHQIWILLCRGICSSNLPPEHKWIKNRLGFLGF
jgi:hypothetical protein